jgi:hypothetical protein
VKSIIGGSRDFGEILVEGGRDTSCRAAKVEITEAASAAISVSTPSPEVMTTRNAHRHRVTDPQASASTLKTFADASRGAEM